MTNRAPLLLDLPRSRPRHALMQVIDAGHLPDGKKGIRWRCRCGYDTGWVYDDASVSENRRGRPCPACIATGDEPRR